MRRFVIAIGLAGCLIKPPPPEAQADAAVETDAPSTAGVNIIFVASTPVRGDLGGVAAADAICRAAAGSLDANTYIAWFGTSASNPRARIGNARGWVRPDGLPVADSADDLLAGDLLYPVTLDEHGNQLLVTDVLTGMDTSGPTADNCADGMATANNGTVGASDAEGLLWTSVATAPCSGMFHLYCLGTERQHEVTKPNAPIGAKKIFVSNQVWTPEMGLAVADAACKSEGGTPSYKAFLTVAGTMLSERFDTSRTYARPDGVAVGTLGTSVAAPVLLDSTGHPTSAPVWTGAPSATDPIGTDGTQTANCHNWSGATFQGTAANALRASREWVYESTSSCGLLSGHVYCVEL